MSCRPRPLNFPVIRSSSGSIRRSRCSASGPFPRPPQQQQQQQNEREVTPIPVEPQPPKSQPAGAEATSESEQTAPAAKAPAADPQAPPEFKEVRQFTVPIIDKEIPVPSTEIVVTAVTTARGVLSGSGGRNLDGQRPVSAAAQTAEAGDQGFAEEAGEVEEEAGPVELGSSAAIGTTSRQITLKGLSGWMV